MANRPEVKECGTSGLYYVADAFYVELNVGSLCRSGGGLRDADAADHRDAQLSREGRGRLRGAARQADLRGVCCVLAGPRRYHTQRRTGWGVGGNKGCKDGAVERAVPEVEQYP